MLKKNKGFTLMEIMIVVAIIGLLAAIALPNFMQARQNAVANTCITNLRQIQSAKIIYSMENQINTGDEILITVLVPDYLRSEPRCPLARNEPYNVNALGFVPTCPHGGPINKPHELFE